MSESETLLKTIIIKSTNASTSEIKIEGFSITVFELKVKIHEKLEISPCQQRLIFRGKVLKDENSLEFYEIADGLTVHLVKSSGCKLGTTTSAAPTASTTVPQSSGPPYTTPPAAAFPSPFGANMFGGFPGAGAGGMDMNRMQQQLMNNPEMMQQMMNSPMMDSLLNNPEMMRDMMMNNPQMQSLMDSNPQIRHVLNDPSVLRQTMEMMRNPNAMREAMRSQDLALSQIENHPGGYNALRRMYEDIQEPMMDAQNAAAHASASNTWGGSTAASTNTANPSSGSINSTALPNPWGRPAAPAANPMGGYGGAGAGGFGGANPFAAMGGLGGMGGMGGAAGAGGLGGIDPAQMNAMMSNPMVQQMMSQMMSDPNFIQQVCIVLYTLYYMFA